MEVFDEGIGARMETGRRILEEMDLTFEIAEETLEAVQNVLELGDPELDLDWYEQKLYALIDAIDYENYARIKELIHLINDKHRYDFHK